MKEPKTAKEALLAEILSDFDRVFEKHDQLIAAQKDLEKNLQKIISTVDDSSSKFRQAVISFTEQAKTDLKNYSSEQFTSLIEELKTGLKVNQRLEKRENDLSQVLIDKFLTGFITSLFIIPSLYFLFK